MIAPASVRRIAATAVLALRVTAVHAQEPQPASQPAGSSSPSPSAAPQLLVAVDARRDRLRYHFDNPSSADTPFLVPHFFEQAYDADNVWLTGTARYIAGVRWESSFGVTPDRTIPADDYDTFVDPGDVVIVSGTTGTASARSMLVSQRAEIGHLGPIQVTLGYRLRWDRFDFHLGHKTVTRNGVLIAASDVTSPEMTDSKVHELPIGFRASPSIGGAWHLSLTGEISPMTLARLSVQLPEKYPGQDLVFFAKVCASSARVALARAGTQWPIEIALQVERTWSYRSTDRLSRSAQSIALSAGRSF